MEVVWAMAFAQFLLCYLLELNKEMETDESLFRFAMKNDILVWILNDWLNWKNDWLCNLHRFCKLVIFALSTALVCPSVP